MYYFEFQADKHINTDDTIIRLQSSQAALPITSFYVIKSHISRDTSNLAKVPTKNTSWPYHSESKTSSFLELFSFPLYIILLLSLKGVAFRSFSSSISFTFCNCYFKLLITKSYYLSFLIQRHFSSAYYFKCTHPSVNLLQDSAPNKIQKFHNDLFLFIHLLFFFFQTILLTGVYSKKTMDSYVGFLRTDLLVNLVWTPKSLAMQLVLYKLVAKY